MLLMIMVSHLSWSQYPLVKKLGKDEVVIMTIKQGEDINKQFALLKDSVSKYKNKLTLVQNSLTDSIRTINKDKDRITTELRIAKSDLAWYQKEVGQYRIAFLEVNASHRKAMVGLTIAVAVFASSVVFLGKNL